MKNIWLVIFGLGWTCLWVYVGFFVFRSEFFVNFVFRFRLVVKFPADCQRHLYACPRTAPDSTCSTFLNFIHISNYFRCCRMNVVFVLNGVEVSSCWTATAGGRGMSTMVSRTEELVFVVKLIILELLLPGLVTSV